MPESASLFTSIPGFFDSFLGSLALAVKAGPTFLEGAFISVSLVLCAMTAGFCLGVPLAVMQVYGSAPARRFAGVYAWFFRGVPILVLLYLFYFGLARQLNLNISPFLASCLVLGLTSTAYQSQIVRGAILSLPEGQMKAAKAIGMSQMTAITSIILPQAMRLSLPGWSNEFSILLKDSALVSVLGTLDLMFRARAMAESRPTEMTTYFLAAGVMYFAITLLGTGAFRLAERTLRIPGYSQQ